MKNLLFTSLLCLLSFNALAECKVLKGKFGNTVLGRFDGEILYKGPYSFDGIAHVEKDVIYKGKYGHQAIAHIEKNVIYKGAYGYDEIAFINEGATFKDEYYQSLLYRLNEGLVMVSRHEVFARLQGCSLHSQLNLLYMITVGVFDAKTRVIAREN